MVCLAVALSLVVLGHFVSGWQTECSSPALVLSPSENVCRLRHRGLSAKQVAAQLGPQLSKESSVFGADDVRWANATERYDPYMQPQFRVVARAGREDDVPKIVDFANCHGIPFLTVGQKHGMTTTLSAFDGIQLDIGLLRDIKVSPETGTAWFQGGVRADEVINTLWEQGFVTTTGSTSCVGLLGPALGGGRGRLEGFYGLISDNFVTLNVVLANGTAATITEKSHPDLFWAMKGAGHNFGVVTSLEARIFPRPAESFYYRNYVWTQDKLETLFHALNQLHQNGTQAKEMVFNYGTYRIEPSVSDNEAIIWWSFAYAGTRAEAQPYLEPFERIEAVTVEDGSVAYPEIAQATGTGAVGWLCRPGYVHIHYSAGTQIWDVNAQRRIYELFNRNVQHDAAYRTSAVVMEDYSQEGVRAVDPASSAYPWRDRSLLSFIAVTYMPNSTLDAFATRWAKDTRDIWNGAQRHLPPSTYVNYAQGDESVESMYGYEPWRLTRLRALKAEYDPMGRFSYYNPITTK